MNLFLLYSGLRLRYYLRASGHALLRQWQWLLLLSLVVPGLPLVTLVATSSGLLKAMLTGPWRPAGISAVMAAGLAWTGLQRESVSGGTLAAYAPSLAIPPIVSRNVDLVVLLVADLLPLLIFTAPLATAPSDLRLPLTSLLFAMLAAQFALLRQGPIPIIGACASAFILGLNSDLALPALAAAIFTLAVPTGSSARRRTPRASGMFDRLRISPALRIQLQILAVHRTKTALRLAAASTVAIAADGLSVLFASDDRVLPMAVVALAIVALLLGGLYRLLDAGQRPMRAMMASLPLPRSFWAYRDGALVLAIGTVPFALLLVWLYSHGVVAQWQLPMLFGASAGLLLVLRPTQMTGHKLGTLLGVLIATAWTGIAIAAVVQ